MSDELQQIEDALVRTIDEWVNRGKEMYGNMGAPASIFATRQALQTLRKLREEWVLVDRERLQEILESHYALVMSYGAGDDREPEELLAYLRKEDE